ncbi:hypothetical protein FACS1894186_1230 [Alphaproteobacteria bacterium]|nr:hypothetical protein FACS1894186_1230 [Alphaproteobacteria bacterium]
MFSMFIFQKQLAQQKQLEEVNAAGAIRTLRDAVKASVASDKEAYPEGVTLRDASEFLPQEYFSGFRVAVRREGAKLSAVIVSPTSLGRYALDNLSAARISSMLGASGGFVPSLTDEPSSTASGTLGLWSLDMASIDASLADPVRIVVQLDFPDTGNEFAEEKEKLLYRTSEYGQSSNTMLTSLFFNDGSVDTIILDPTAGSISADGNISAGSLSVGGGSFTVGAGGKITAATGTFSGLVKADDFQTTGGLSVTKLVPQAFYADLANGASIPKPSCPAGFTATVELTPKEINYTAEIDNTPNWTECECEMMFSNTYTNIYNRSNCPFRTNRGGIGTTGIIPCYGDGTYARGQALSNITKAPKDWTAVSAKKLEWGQIRVVPVGCNTATLPVCYSWIYPSRSTATWQPIDSSPSPSDGNVSGKIWASGNNMIFRITYRHKDYPLNATQKPALQPQSRCAVKNQDPFFSPNWGTGQPLNAYPATYNLAIPVILSHCNFTHDCPFGNTTGGQIGCHNGGAGMVGFFITSPVYSYKDITWGQLTKPPAGWHLATSWLAPAGKATINNPEPALKLADAMVGAALVWREYLDASGALAGIGNHSYTYAFSVFYEQDGVMDQDFGNNSITVPYVDIKASATVSGAGPWTVALVGYKKTDAQVYCKRN